MLYCNKTNISEWITLTNQVSQKNVWFVIIVFFFNSNYTYETEVCYGCHDISRMVYEIENIAILNIKGVDFRCVIWNMARNDAIDRSNNSELGDKGSLWIWKTPVEVIKEGAFGGT